MMSCHDHDKAVQAVASQVEKFHKERKGFRVFHGSTNSTRPPQYTASNTVNIQSLNHVLEVNSEERTVTVEPNVTLGRLLDATMKANLMPPVVPELPDISVGGAYSGQAAESSSWNWGLFDQTVQSIEIVLADGSIKTSSKSQDPDLLTHAASAFGTLGIVTKLVITLIDAPKFIELTYHPIASVKDATITILDLTEESKQVDYIDGMMLTSTTGVIMAGKPLSTIPPGTKPQGFTKRSDPWFYLHAQDQLKRHKGKGTFTVIIPLVDYLFRYHRGGFWVGKYAFQYFHVPNTRITRYLLDNCMKTSALSHAFHETRTLASKYVVQDMGVVPERVPDFVSKIDEIFPTIRPLWLCPLKGHVASALLPRDFELLGNVETAMLINVGVYGGPRKPEKFLEENLALERGLCDLQGIKGL